MTWRLSLRKLRAGAGFAIICAKANCFDKGEVVHFSYYDDITGLQIPLASRGIVQHLEQLSSLGIGLTMMRILRPIVCGVTKLEKLIQEMVYSKLTSRDS